MKERYSFQREEAWKPLQASLMQAGFGKYVEGDVFKNLIFGFNLDEEWNACRNPDTSFDTSDAFFHLLNIIHIERTDNETVIVEIILHFVEWSNDKVDLRKITKCLKDLYFEESGLKQLSIRGNKLNKKKVPQSPSVKVTRDAGKVFIIHGHDRGALLELEKLMKEEFNLKPIIIQESPNEGLDTIISKFERLANESILVIALFTPDDRTSENAYRARQNVILEFGYFLGRDQGSDRKIIVLRKGQVEFPSDINGVLYMKFNESVNEVHLQLKKQLQHWKIIH